MEKYEKYKDSGVDWIGDIPEHWGQGKLKNFCSLKGRIGWNGLRSDEFQQLSYAYLVTGQDFTSDSIDWSQCYQIDQARYEEDPFIQLANGDILITKDGTIGKIATVKNLNKPACLNSGIFVMKQTKGVFSQDYLYWLLVSDMLKEFNKYTSSGTTILHLYQNVFERMPVVVPPIDEQEGMASFLTSECSKIDSLIATQQKRVELLKELRQSVITKAVTKGLDPNVKMKESGAVSIGQIPADWDIRRIKYVCSCNDESLPNSTNDETIIRYVEIGDVDYVEGVKNYTEYRFKDAPSRARRITNPGDVIVSTVRTYLRAIARIMENGLTVSTGFAVLRAVNIEPEYLSYYCLSESFIDDVISESVGVSYPAVNASQVVNLKIPVPSINEQKSIVDYLDAECHRIDSLIAAQHNRTSLLKEYKQSLITEVVTGKYKVC